MARTLQHTSDDAASRALAAADPALGALIDALGTVEVTVTGGGFSVMANSIVSQQLSTKVAATIWERLSHQVGTDPEALAAAPHEQLRSIGLSNRKAEYLHGIAEATLSGDVVWEELEHLDDEAVIETLTHLRGVGRWTAEMYLIFALGRPDVLALDDHGVRVAAGRLVGLDGPIDRESLSERAEAWSPHRSAASLWLWKGLE